jgi:murein DD-endopeptidase MepM/ murein hydrolase activator NlpD
VEISGGFTVMGPMDGFSEEDRDLFTEENEGRASASASLVFDSSVEPSVLYNFYPMSGNLDRDLVVSNFVDLRPGYSIGAWNCTKHTYDGHRGHDVGIRTFGEQLIGIPILAAMDGVVRAARDGLPDMNTGPPMPSPTFEGNYVFIDHEFGEQSRYYHMKKGSVAVSSGQTVKAGQQIGMVGSSGNSGWPHLHFDTRNNGIIYETFAGPCRPGPSGWAKQPPIGTQTAPWDFAINASGELNELPVFDQPRTGTLLLGFQNVANWILIRNVPANVSDRVQIRRPDGSHAPDTRTQK